MGKCFHVKFEQTDGRTDRQMDNGKTICHDLSIQGHKKGYQSYGSSALHFSIMCSISV